MSFKIVSGVPVPLPGDELVVGAEVMEIGTELHPDARGMDNGVPINLTEFILVCLGVQLF